MMQGEDNPTDYLSRHTPKTPTTTEQKEQLHNEAELIDAHANEIIGGVLPAAITPEQMRTAMARDPKLQLLITAIQRGYMQNTNKVMPKPYLDIFS